MSCTRLCYSRLSLQGINRRRDRGYYKNENMKNRNKKLIFYRHWNYEEVETGLNLLLRGYPVPRVAYQLNRTAKTLWKFWSDYKTGTKRRQFKTDSKPLNRYYERYFKKSESKKSQEGETISPSFTRLSMAILAFLYRP